jgi:transposase
VQEDAGISLKIVKRSEVAKGFYVPPKRWIVERTYGWLGRCRRLAKDYENLTRSHVGFIMLAMMAHAAPNCKFRGRHVKCSDGL